MPDFPGAVPDIPDASIAETLYTMHGALGHVQGTNRILANLRALATKLGLNNGTGPGGTGAVLRRTAAGESGWGPLVNADVSATAGIDLTKLMHVGAGNVLRSNGTTNVAGKLVAADISPGAGFVRIAKQTATGGATILLVFTSIPQVYERLLLQWEMKVTNNAGAGLSSVTLQVGFAPSTFAVDAQYSMHRFQTNGGITAAQDSLAATAYVAGFAPQNNVAPGRVGRGIVEFPNYASSGLYKSFTSRGGAMLGAEHTAGNYLQWMHFGQYENNTGAIQCIQIAAEGYAMLDGSSATLWGVPAS